MIVMKFGGTSVGDAAGIRRVVAIVREQLERGPVVVVSAHAGVTDLLLDLAAVAPAGGGGDLVEQIAGRHRAILADLGLDPAELDELLAELADLARGLRLVGGASPKAVDRLLSYGERCSARTLALALRDAGIDAAAVDAFAVGLRTDSAFGRARPLPDDGRIAAALARIAGVPVVTGFLAADEQGNVTTLGRDGSDYSAALFGAALAVAEVQIWKDVDGVRTADPRLVPAARSIPRMSYHEIRALASFGSRVLHPAALEPAMARRIPILIRDTRAPARPGTRIDADGHGDARAVAVAHRGDIALATLTADRMLPQHAFLAAVFAALGRAEVDAAPIAVSEGAVTFACDAVAVERVGAELGGLGHLGVRSGCALVGLIGGDPAAALTTLAAAGLTVRCAGVGADGATVAAVVDESALAAAAFALHARFCAAEGA